MNYEEFKNLGSAINSIVTSGAILLGGYWAYLKFVRTREGAPKIEFWVELNFIRRRGDHWIAEAVAQVENKGLVRHTMKTFKYDVRYARTSDELPSRRGCAADLIQVLVINAPAIARNINEELL